MFLDRFSDAEVRRGRVAIDHGGEDATTVCLDLRNAIRSAGGAKGTRSERRSQKSSPCRVRPVNSINASFLVYVLSPTPL